MVKFQNSKHELRANNNEINVKNKQLITELLLNQTFSPDKIWNKGQQNYIIMLFSSWEIYYITWTIAILYTSHWISRMYIK